MVTQASSLDVSDAPGCRTRLFLNEAAARHLGCWPHGGHCLCPWTMDLPVCLVLASEMEGGSVRGGSLPLGKGGPIQERPGLLRPRRHL